jgi:putative transposase
MQYRRANNKGGTYFFTVNMTSRCEGLLVEHVDVLRNVVRDVQQRHPFHIDAFVVLPDHLHAVWTLPRNDADFSRRWMLIKAGFSRRIPPCEVRNASRLKKGERGIWQRRFWEHMIRNQNDHVNHVDYVHYNPVKHGYVALAADWPYSSIHRHIAAGRLPRDWGGREGINEQNGYGER